jgi:Lipopolysaccharide kinase (Kdo/WaaP) family
MASRSLYVRSPEWALDNERLDGLLNSPDFRVVKRTSRTLAGIAYLNGVEVFLKRVTNGSWIKGVATRAGGSKARKTIRGARILRRAGFAHPTLLAAFERSMAGSVQATCVIVEYLRRPKVLSRFALADGRDFKWRRWLSKQVAETVRSLHTAGCYTRDLQETNLMLEGQGDSLKIYFTDLEDFRWLPLIPWQLRLQNLVQLDRSIGRFVSRAHRLRFLYNYLGEQTSRAEARTVVARLHHMRQRIEHHKLRRGAATILTPPPDQGHSDRAPEFPLGGKNGLSSQITGRQQ